MLLLYLNTKWTNFYCLRLRFRPVKRKDEGRYSCLLTPAIDLDVGNRNEGTQQVDGHELRWQNLSLSVIMHDNNDQRKSSPLEIMDHKHDDDDDEDDNENMASDNLPHFVDPQKMHAMVALLKGQKYIINCSAESKYGHVTIDHVILILFK